jgi:hypothetical protein
MNPRTWIPKPSLAKLAIAAALLAAIPRPIHAQTLASDAAPAAQDSEDISANEGLMIRTVRTDLVQEKFDEIDRLADQYRRGKDRWPGGNWKLHTLYEALDAPHQTDKDTSDHLDHLRKWMTTRPESITARVALATSLHRWAWVARGNGLAKTVTPEGWNLFNLRVKEAQTVLESARDMHIMCPQWYSEEMTVGLAQGWTPRQMQELFDRAVQFEPTWQFYYKARANYLLPKWYGSANDVTSFAKEAADRLGSDTGDMMYFEMATVIIKRGNGTLDPLLKGMDWPRIQRGYQQLTTQFGPDRTQKNRLAFMAYKFNDPSFARQQFASIGNGWSRSVWRDRNYFEKVRDWSTGHTAWPAQ